MDILIFTPIQKEYLAIRKHLTNLQPITKDNCNYEVGEFVGQHQKIQVALRQTGPRNVPMAIAVSHGYQHFKPKIALLVGVAGGVKDVTVGDAVIATKAYGYASGKEHASEKEKEGAYVARPVVYPFSVELISIAERVAQAESWKSRIGNDQARPRVYFAPIASDDKLVATRFSNAYEIIKKHFNDTAALDMEAIGFGESAFQYPLLRSLTIRGISDLLDNKQESDDAGSQELAAATAAAFAIELLNQLNLDTLNYPDMTLKQTVAATTDLIQPNLEIILGESKEIPTNRHQQLVWTKVAPIIIHEIEDLKADPKDKSPLQDIPGVLKSYLRKNEDLQKELVVLIEEIKKTESPDAPIFKSNKNVFYKTTIKFEKDGHIGDNITNYNGNIDKQWTIKENNGDFNFGKE